jgi:hypothetical protein
VRGVEGEIDKLNIELDGRRRIRYGETRALLAQLGFDVSRFRPPPRMLACEQHCSRWPTERDYLQYEAMKEHRREVGPAPDSLGAGQVVIRHGSGQIPRTQVTVGDTAGCHRSGQA